jgi:lysophospholipase L1-like esterase
LAIGGSASVGFQPTLAHPRGQATSFGYAEDLVALEQQRWPGLTVVHLGCPGATTATVLGGGGKCPYAEGSQLLAAETFLETHPTTVLVTIDLGFNDLLSCMRHEVVNAPCVDESLTTVHDQLAQILTGIKAAAPSGARLAGVGHYDPYLGDYLDGPAGQAFALSSLAVIDRLNDVMRADYAAAHAPMADVAGAFEMASTAPTAWPGSGLVPRNVARTCALTWECAPGPLGPNKHPNDQGYRVIGEAITDAVAAH